MPSGRAKKMTKVTGEQMNRNTDVIGGFRVSETGFRSVGALACRLFVFPCLSMLASSLYAQAS
jgi:hypothetical protein